MLFGRVSRHASQGYGDNPVTLPQVNARQSEGKTERLEGERAVLIHLAQSLTKWSRCKSSQLLEKLLKEKTCVLLHLADGIIIYV